MYCSLLLLLIASASSAPQTGKETESDITYVKIQPITEQSAPAKTPYRESRIENLRLTVPNVGAKRFSGRIFKNRKDSQEVLLNEKSFVNTRPLVLESDERRDVLVNEKGFVNMPPLVLVSDERNDILVNEKGLAFGKSIDSQDNDRKNVNKNFRDPRKELFNDTQKDLKHSIEGDLPDELNLRKNLDEKHFTEPNSYESDEGIESNLTKRSPDSISEPKDLQLSESIGRPLEAPELPTLEEKIQLDTPELPKLEEKRFSETPVLPKLEEKRFSETPVLPKLEEKRFSETPELPKLEEKRFSETPELPKLEDKKFYLEDPVPVRNVKDTTIYDDISDTTSKVTEPNEYLEEIIKDTEQYESRTRAPTPRFLSKLSYFHKNEEERSLVTNFIERSGLAGYRQFVTKCRCGKIWDCPKLQITVGRCPNEYFLCC